jgi:hypothetical protein
MVTNDAHDDRAPERHPEGRRLLPIAGIIAAVVAVVGHFGLGAAAMHLGLGAGLAYFGVNVANLGGGVLAIGLVAVILIKLLVVLGARRWLRPH